MSEPVVADKLILVSQVEPSLGGAPWVLEKPIWIRAGDRYWLDEQRRALLVGDPSGMTQAHPCWFASGSDAPR